MTIGFRSPYQNISTVLGKLSGFNLWSYQIKAEEILRMSQGCGNEAGDVKAWETVSKGLTKEVEVKRHRSCRDRKGKFYLTSLIPCLTGNKIRYDQEKESSHLLGFLSAS